MSTQTTDLTAWLDELEEARKAGSQGRWFWNTYSAITSTERARIYNEAEEKITDDAPDEDWEALPEFWVASVPVAGGDTGTRQGQADAALIVAAVNALPKLTAALRAVLALADAWITEAQDLYFAGVCIRGAVAAAHIEEGR